MSSGNPSIINGKTYALSASSSSSSVQVYSSAATSVMQYEIYNAGTVDVFMATGLNSATAAVPTTATPGFGNPIGPGMLKIMSSVPSAYWAAITASSTATVYITPVEGE